MHLLACKATILVLGITCSVAALAADAHRFTVRDSLEMQRFGVDEDSEPNELDDDGICSPDGRFCIKISHRAVFPPGKTEGTIWLFDQAAIKRSIASSTVPTPNPGILVRLSAAVNGIEFIRERGNVISRPSWIDGGQRLAFLGRDDQENRQLFEVDMSSREIKALSPPEQDVVDFAWEANQLTYLASAGSPDEHQWQLTGGELPDIENGTGKTLEQLMFPMVRDNFHGTVDLQVWQVKDEHARAVPSAATAKPLTINTRYVTETMAVSPDGRWLVTIGSDGSKQPPANELSPQDVAHGMQYRLIDLVQGTSRPLLNAWIDNADLARYRAAWSRDGRWIAVTETRTTQVRKSSSEIHCDVAITSLDTPDASCLAAPGDAEHGFLYGLSWSATRDELRLRFRRSGSNLYADRVVRRASGRWELTEGWGNPAGLPLELTADESLNSPPVLVAVDPVTKRRREIFDPNPWLKSLDLGMVRNYEWVDGHGRRISGGLVLPPGYAKGHRYPLVIQTHGFDPYGFFVTGGSATTHAGRAIAARDMVVLQVAGVYEPYFRTWQDSRENGTNVYLAAIDQLAKENIIDPKRVGISGYSATGRQVADAITFAPDRFAAAVLANTDPVSLANYFFFVDGPNHPIAEAVDAGTKPYGAGLEKWLERSPGFNTDKIRAPVLISAGGPEHLLHLWSLYAALRDQGKPVDLQYIRSGMHNFAMPLHKLAHQEAMVDWFDFWLNHHEDAAPEKKDQYVRWKRLAEMRTN